MRPPAAHRIRTDAYEDFLRELHLELVAFQRHVIASERRVLILLEGRDAAGKDGVIKRMTRHLSPRETLVFAPSRPTERDQSSWYFQRFLPHLPAGGEIVFFNRSWYNRAGVERVMGFCSEDQCERFLQDVVPLEELLVGDGLELRKVYLDLSREEQAERLEDRRRDPLKQWKISPVDARAMELWDDYSAARDEMLRRTSHAAAPWAVACADHKKTARIQIIRHLLASFDYEGRRDELLEVDPAVVFPFAEERLSDGSIAP